MNENVHRQKRANVKLLYTKLQPWSVVKEELQQTLRLTDSEDVTVMVPYGLQLVHSLHHPHVLRCMTQYHSTKGDIYVTHIDSGAANVMYTWTINNIDEHKVVCKKFPIQPSICKLISIPQHRVFVGFCTDMTVKVLSDTIHRCQELSSTPFPSSIVCMIYNEDTDELITGGHGILAAWKMAHIGLRDPLTPGRPINVHIRKDEWVRELILFKKQKQMVVMCDEGVHMIDYVTNQKLVYMKNWHQTALTSFVWYRPLEYFITASMDGAIKVWNAVVFGQVHEFIGHYDCVTGLETHPTDPLLVSGSKDGTVRIWRLDTFQLTQRLDVGEKIFGLKLGSNNSLYYYTLHDVKIWDFNQFHHLFTPIQSCIHKLAKIKKTDQTTRILCAAEDGSIRLISSTSGMVVTIVYPMPTYQIHTDIVYDPVCDHIYTVLATGDVLVFDASTNPCEVRALWVPDIQEELVLCLALMRLEDTVGLGEPTTKSLIFAGLNSGQISLLHAVGRVMKHPVQAHCGIITALECSHGHHEGNSNKVGDMDLLVSCGTDKTVKVWRVCFSPESSLSVLLQNLYAIPCMLCPTHVSMIGNTLCIVLPNNVLQMYELLNEDQNAFLPMKPKQENYRVLSHHKDHNHSLEITSLCSCISLGLFATTSNDGSIKIWDRTNTLVRELCFDWSLRGVCFANDHGDLLLGFQNHISFVNVASYLPCQKLEELLSMTFPDDINEEPIEFNHELQLWFDLAALPTFPTDLSSRQQMVNKFSNHIQQHWQSSSFFTSSSDPLTTSFFTKTNECTSKYSHVTSELKISKTIGRRIDAFALSRGSSDEEIERDSVEEELVDSEVFKGTSESSNMEEMDPREVASMSEVTNPWPIAPDGYIPNSALRGLIGYHYSPNQPPSPPPWKLKMIPEGCFDLHDLEESENSYENHEPFVWESSSEDDLLNLESLSSRAASNTPMGLSLPAHSRDITPNQSGLNALNENKLQLRSLNLSKLEIPTFEPSEGRDKSQRGKNKKDRSHRTNTAYGHGRQNVETKGQAEKEDGSSEDDEEDEGDGQEKLVLLKKIAEYPWFPMGIPLDVESMVRAILTLLETTRDAQYRTVCQALIDIYREYRFSDKLKDDTIDFFQEKLSSPRGPVRANAVWVLTQLGCRRQDVILSLIPKLADDEEEVRAETITAMGCLAGIRSRADLTRYLAKIGVIEPYQNHDEEVLNDLSERCSKVSPTSRPYLNSALNRVMAHREKFAAKAASRRSLQDKENQAKRDLVDWDERLLQNNGIASPSGRCNRGNKLQKKQKRQVQRTLRRMPRRRDETGGMVEDVDEEGKHKNEEMVIESEDSGSDEEVSSFEVGFMEQSHRDIPQKRHFEQRKTNHEQMRVEKENMMGRDKLVMVYAMKEKLQAHRKRYDRLVRNIAKQASLRKRILPINPFFYRYYGDVRLRKNNKQVNSGGSESCVLAHASETSKEPNLEDGSTTVTTSNTASISSELERIGPCPSKAMLDETKIESGFGESTFRSLTRTTFDQDSRTFYTQESSGIYTASLGDGLSITTQKLTPQRPKSTLTIENVKRHEVLSAKAERDPNKLSCPDPGVSLKVAKEAIAQWRDFLKSQRKTQPQTDKATQSEPAFHLTVPCMKPETTLCCVKRGQRLLYSVTAVKSRSHELDVALKSRYFRDISFGNLHMTWTDLSPLRDVKPRDSMTTLPPLQHRPHLSLHQREMLSTQMLFPSLFKLHHIYERKQKCFERASNKAKRKDAYIWQCPDPVIISTVQSRMVQVDKPNHWKKCIKTSTDHNKLVPEPPSAKVSYFKFEAPDTPIVPRNSSISSSQEPKHLVQKLKT